MNDVAKKPRVERVPKSVKLMRRVTKTDHCWLWTGAKNESGYGVMEINNRLVRVHRLSYELLIGEIPDGMMVCHKCDVRNCIRPDHLFLGKAAENNADMRAKGRASGNKKLTMDQIREIRDMLRNGDIPQRSIAKIFGINQGSVSDIKTGRNKRVFKL